MLCNTTTMPVAHKSVLPGVGPALVLFVITYNACMWGLPPVSSSTLHKTKFLSATTRPLRVIIHNHGCTCHGEVIFSVMQLVATLHSQDPHSGFIFHVDNTVDFVSHWHDSARLQNFKWSSVKTHAVFKVCVTLILYFYSLINSLGWCAKEHVLPCEFNIVIRGQTDGPNHGRHKKPRDRLNLIVVFKFKAL